MKTNNYQPERIKDEYKEKTLLRIFSTYQDKMLFEDLLHYTGMAYVSFDMYREFYGKVNIKPEDEDLLYYETIYIDPDTELEIVCYIATTATASSFAFELTQENWDNHIKALKEQQKNEIKGDN